MNIQLKSEVKREWVADLRSGRYPQTQFRLHVVDKIDDCPDLSLEAAVPVGYCCLGVLCETAERLKLVALVREVKPDEVRPVVTEQYGNSTSDLPPEVAEAVFISGWECEDLSEATVALTGMNDTGDDDFNKIADWVEANL